MGPYVPEQCINIHYPPNKWRIAHLRRDWLPSFALCLHSPYERFEQSDRWLHFVTLFIGSLYRCAVAVVYSLFINILFAIMKCIVDRRSPLFIVRSNWVHFNGCDCVHNWNNFYCNLMGLTLWGRWTQSLLLFPCAHTHTPSDSLSFTVSVASKHSIRLWFCSFVTYGHALRAYQQENQKKVTLRTSLHSAQRYRTQCHCHRRRCSGKQCVHHSVIEPPAKSNAKNVLE